MLLRYLQRHLHRPLLHAHALVQQQPPPSRGRRRRQSDRIRHHRSHYPGTHAAEKRTIQKIHHHLYDRYINVYAGSCSAMVFFYPLLETGVLALASLVSAYNSFFLIPLVPIMLELSC
jgi:hypothetical protein